MFSTVPIDTILSVKNARAWVSMDFTLGKYSAPRTIEKIKILGAVLELPAKQHCQSSQEIGPNWPNRHYCLAGSSKKAPKILIFCVDYSFYVKTIKTHARAFLTLNILAIARVLHFMCPMKP